jgi:hypothetical protein
MSGGKVKVFLHNTDDLASLYADAAGTTPLSNPMSIDTDGRTLGVFVDDGSLYRIEVYGVSGNLEWTVDNVTGGSGGAGGSGISSISSSDGSITIFQDGNDIDITMTNDKPTVWVSDDTPAVYEQYLNEDGDFVLSEGSKVGTGLELVDGTLTVREDGWYHVSVNWNVEKGAGYLGETREIKLLVNGEIAGETLDMSMARDLRYGAWNGDLELEAGDTIVFSTDGLEDDHKTAARLNKVSVHKLASVIGGNTYTAGNGISLSPQGVISVDTSVVATQQDLDDVNQVPTSTSGDSGKVLTVDSSGTPAWAAAPSGGETYTAGNAISITNGQHHDKVISVKLKNNGGLQFYNATLSPDWNSIEVKTDDYTTYIDPSNGALKVAMPVSPYGEPGQILTMNNSYETEWKTIVLPEGATVIEFSNDPTAPMSEALDGVLEKLIAGTASLPVYMKLPAFDGSQLQAGARFLQLVEWEYASPWYNAEMKFSAANRFYDNTAQTMRYGFEQLEVQRYGQGTQQSFEGWYSQRHEFMAFTPTIVTL